MSSRRVQKGPGRRPQSAKRQRFMELRERGWSIHAAAREVGVSRSAGNNWARGYKTYRQGEVVGFVPALERLAVRQISPRYLSQDERIEIADLYQNGSSIRQIARQLGRAPSTVSRELSRNSVGRRGYRPFEAHRRATGRRARSPQRRVASNTELRQVVVELLAQRWSPQQISRQLRLRFPAQPEMWLCHESIYQAVYQPGSGLFRPSALAPHRRSPLRTGRDHRRAHQRSHRPAYEDLVRREFTAPAANMVWLSDLTEHPTREGKLYLCAIKDVWSRRIVGYSISDRMTSAIAVTALDSAVARRSAARQSTAGCVLHTDRGSQFRSRKLQQALTRHDMLGSMGQVGSAGDNAAMESFFSLLQKNVLNRQIWDTRDQLRIAIVTWIERTYHRRRRQTALGRLTPIEYELIMSQTANQAA